MPRKSFVPLSAFEVHRWALADSVLEGVSEDGMSGSWSLLTTQWRSVLDIHAYLLQERYRQTLS